MRSFRSDGLPFRSKRRKLGFPFLDKKNKLGLPENVSFLVDRLVTNQNKDLVGKCGAGIVKGDKIFGQVGESSNSTKKYRLSLFCRNMSVE